MVLTAYNNRCAVSSMRVVEVLEAAHIQPYIDERSNHIQNGICLRSDIHRLLDGGLISIDENFCLLVSKKLKNASSAYAKLDARELRLPTRDENRPSRAAVRYHRQHMFVG